MTAASLFAPWPEPPHVAAMRTSITAIRALCEARTTGLASLANDAISARTILALLPEETP